MRLCTFCILKIGGLEGVGRVKCDAFPPVIWVGFIVVCCQYNSTYNTIQYNTAIYQESCEPRKKYCLQFSQKYVLVVLRYAVFEPGTPAEDHRTTSPNIFVHIARKICLSLFLLYLELEERLYLNIFPLSCSRCAMWKP